MVKNTITVHFFANKAPYKVYIGKKQTWHGKCIKFSVNEKRKCEGDSKMNFFKRLRDIINSNLNHTLDKIEDPEKMIKYTIDQMEETLVKAKSSIAANMAKKITADRQVKELGERIAQWDARAKLAVGKGLDDLAREALVEKKKLQASYDNLSSEAMQYEAIVNSQKEQLDKLTIKLAEMKAKQKTLVARATQAKEKIEIAKSINSSDTTDMFRRFDELESKIEHLEASAQMESSSSPVVTTEGKFADMEKDEEIEAELAALKAKKESN
jgi:phage shock protein A